MGIVMKRGVFLLFGSNRGNRLGNILKALDRISRRAGPVLKRSSVYETDPWGFEDPIRFLNMVVEIDSSLNPSSLLGLIKETEVGMGRVRKGHSYRPRSIDVDILLYNNLIIDSEALTIPHPHLPARRFALVPLVEIAPGLVHPVLRKTMSTLLKQCTDGAKVDMYKPFLAV